MEDATLMPHNGLSVLILSFNEEANIARCIQSVKQLSDDIWVVDSGSTDNTVVIAKELGVNVLFHAWTNNYGMQWNWGLDNAAFKYDYVMIHASDEQIPVTWAKELKEQLDSFEPPDLVLTRFRFFWLGKPVQHGGYGKAYIAKVGKRSIFRYNEKAIDEYVPLQGKLYYMKEKYDHQDAKEVERWVQKHIQYAKMKVKEKEKLKVLKDVENPKLFGKGRGQRIDWIRKHIYNKLPPLLAPWIYFMYRLVFRMGWRDGLTGVYYHFLQALWFYVMVEIFEIEHNVNQKQDL